MPYAICYRIKCTYYASYYNRNHSAEKDRRQKNSNSSNNKTQLKEAKKRERVTSAAAVIIWWAAATVELYKENWAHCLKDQKKLKIFICVGGLWNIFVDCFYTDTETFRLLPDKQNKAKRKIVSMGWTHCAGIWAWWQLFTKNKLSCTDCYVMKWNDL